MRTHNRFWGRGFWGWVGNVTTVLWTVFLVSAACGVFNRSVQLTPAIPTREWTRPVTDAALLDSVLPDADGFVVGTVERTFKDRTYDDCGGIAEFLGKCDAPATFTYRLTVRTAGKPAHLYANVPAGDTLVLPVGTRAVFVWAGTWLKQLGVCWERLRRGAGEYCESDNRAVIRSLNHVFPPADSARVAWAFKVRRRS